MKNYKVQIGLLSVVLVAGAVWKWSPSPELSTVEASADAREAAAMAKAYQENMKAEDRIQTIAAAGVRNGLRAAAVAPAPVRAPFEYSRELSDYSALKRKVFLSDEEKVQRAALFGNHRLIAALGDYLNHASGTDVASVGEQGAALDLLVDALQSKDGNEAAEAALKSVVLDRQIESNDLDMESRKSLAGVKAEVLYQWTALEPGRAKEIRTWLPGPVSEKIWANVTETQSRNHAESAMVGLEDL